MQQYSWPYKATFTADTGIDRNDRKLRQSFSLQLNDQNVSEINTYVQKTMSFRKENGRHSFITSKYNVLQDIIDKPLERVIYFLLSKPPFRKLGTRCVT